MNIVTLESRKNKFLQSQYICEKLFTSEECQKIILSKGKVQLSEVQLHKEKDQDDQIYNPNQRNSVSKFIDLNNDTEWFFDRII